MPDSDEVMLEIIARDPREGIRLVMDAYGQQLHGRLRRRAATCRFGDAHVDDVFQEALISLIEPGAREALLESGGAILPWLTRRGYWRLQDAYRRDLRSLEAQALDASVDNNYSPSEMELAVEGLLMEMSPRDERILRQHYGEGLTYAQVAEASSISPAAAKKAIHDAKARLRRRLEDAGYGIEEGR